jgi:hypothetical protein
MASFGPFEIVRELDTGGGATVSRAQKQDDSKGEYILKVFSPERLLSEEESAAVSELDPLFKDIGASFTKRVSIQKQAADGSPYFAPILAAGHDERGAWYATKFYPRSVKSMLERFVALEARDLYQLVQSVVAATLHLKKTCARPHGNLKPTNILLEGTSKPRSAQVVLTDPLPGDAKEAAVYELADLRAIGEMIYQLVLRRKVDFASGWVMVPVEASKEWQEVFGKQSADWLQLCNRLLERSLSLDNYSLERLQADLARLKPRQSLAVKLIPAGVGVAIAAGVGVWWMTRPTVGTLYITTDPPGSEVLLKETEAQPGQTFKTEADGTPLILTLKEYEYTLKAVYGELESPRRRANVVAGKTVTNHLRVAYGSLVVLSQPPGARFSFAGREETTPWTNPIVKPGPVIIRLSLKVDDLDYVPDPPQLQGIVPTNDLVTLSGRLAPPKPGEEVVLFSSDPPGVRIYTNNALALTTATSEPLGLKLIDGGYAVRAELSGWPSLATNLTVNTRRTRTPAQHFYFPHGTLTVEARGEDGAPLPNAQVLLNGQLAGYSPTNLFLLTNRQYTVAITSPGWETNTQTITLAERGTQTLNPMLKALSGFVTLSSDLAGVKVVDQRGQILTTNLSNEPQQFPLPKGQYNLTASYDDLAPVERRAVDVLPGQTRTVPQFNFAYGTLLFTNLQPPETRIQRADGRLIRTGVAILQRPDQTMAYRIEAPGYQPQTTNVAAGDRQQRVISLALVKSNALVRLTTDPPGLEVYRDGQPLGLAGQDFAMPWGTAKLEARHPRLGSKSLDVEVKLAGPNAVPPFAFTYGTLILTNLADDVVIREGSEMVTPAAGPVRLAYEKPGSHTYEISKAGRKLGTVTTNIVAGALNFLNVGPAKWTSTFAQMDFVFVEGLNAWVAETEVTQQQYQKVLGSDPLGSLPADQQQTLKSPDKPVIYVAPADAERFCEELNRLDTGKLASFKYALPTVDQWTLYAGTITPAEMARQGVFGESFAKPGSLAAVRSKGTESANANGLVDVLGNVWEICRTPTAGAYKIRGGAYNWSATLPLSQNRADTFTQPTAFTGFRVMLVPAGAN